VNGKVTATFERSSGLAIEVRSLEVDEEGTLWAGSSQGVLQYLRGNRFFSAEESAPVPSVFDSPGQPLFMGAESPGFFILRGTRAAFQPLAMNHSADCFFYDSAARTLWMGTLGAGLLRWKEGKIAHLYPKDGLYDSRIYSILRDDHANFWFASSKGIFRLNERELNEFADGQRKSITSLPFSTGQLRFECRAGVQPAAARTHDGRLWFSTTSGLVMLDPQRLSNETVAPRAAVTALIVNGKRISRTSEPRLKPNDADNLDIRYAGLSYISPEKVAFRYLLEGYDRGWVDAGTRREAIYTNLPPGPFTFRVEARNAGGRWSAVPGVLRFTVEPRWYQQKWFIPLAVMAVSLATFGVVRIRIRRLRQRFALVLAERSRIARELHDTLLQGLSGLTMQMQALASRLPSSAEKGLLVGIIQDAVRCSSEARQSLWGLRNTVVDGSDFKQKLTGLVQQLVGERHVAVSLLLQPVSLACCPEYEYQLLRIAREALTNTLKHASALQLNVTLEHSDGLLTLTIEDDGLGFAGASGDDTTHFGIRGMHERAAEIGAELSVISSPEKGTTVALSLRLEQKPQPASNPAGPTLHQV
jgi:signal transduction histidine kinase